MELIGEIEDIIYYNETNSYMIAEFDTEEEQTTIVGYLPFVGSGDNLKVIGNFVEHKKYGRQFKVETFEKLMPQTVGALEKYLANGNIKGVGEALAKRIVSRFGEDTINVFKTEPQRLAEVKGISKAKAIDIAESFLENWEVWQIVGFLERFGIGAEFAKKVYIMHRRDELRADKIVQKRGVVEKPPAGDGHLLGVKHPAQAVGVGDDIGKGIKDGERGGGDHQEWRYDDDAEIVGKLAPEGTRLADPPDGVEGVLNTPKDADYHEDEGRGADGANLGKVDGVDTVEDGDADGVEGVGGLCGLGGVSVVGGGRCRFCGLVLLCGVSIDGINDRLDGTEQLLLGEVTRAEGLEGGQTQGQDGDDGKHGDIGESGGVEHRAVTDTVADGEDDEAEWTQEEIKPLASGGGVAPQSLGTEASELFEHGRADDIRR